MAMSATNIGFSKGMALFYMIGGSIPSVIPALITVRNFGDKGTFISSSLMGSSIWYNNAAVVSTQYGNQFPAEAQVHRKR